MQKTQIRILIVLGVVTAVAVIAAGVLLLGRARSTEGANPQITPNPPVSEAEQTNMGQAWPTLPAAPEGYTLSDALLNEEANSSTHIYLSGWHVLQINVREGEAWPLNISEETTIEAVPLTDTVTADYFRGTWDYPAGVIPPAPGEDLSQATAIPGTWDADAPSQTVVWQSEGYAFFMTAYYERPTDAPNDIEDGTPLSREQLIGLAQQLTP